MAKRANPAFVGAFVIGAIALAIAAVALLGSGSLFRNTHQFVCFFDGNVNGLRVGALVKFKGVEIGEVRQILLSLNAATGPDSIRGGWGLRKNRYGADQTAWAGDR